MMYSCTHQKKERKSMFIILKAWAEIIVEKWEKTKKKKKGLYVISHAVGDGFSELLA